MHLDDDQLQALLDGEVAGPAEESVREHLDRCRACQERLIEAEREQDEVFRALTVLDHEPPDMDPEAVAARRPGHRGWWRWAAGIALAATGAGVAWAAPGSPVPGWIRGALPGMPEAAPVAAPLGQDPGSTGVAVDPGAGLVVEIVPGAAGGLVVVALTDEARTTVRTLEGHATFTADLDRVLVEAGDGPATIQVLVPTGAPRVEVRASGARLLLKVGSDVTAATGPDPDGSYRIRLGPGS